MKKFLCFVIVLIFIFPSIGISGTDHYVDPSQSYSLKDGSYEHPWDSVSDIQDHVFSTGDDVYFKVGTKLFPKTKLTIDWSGTSSDPVIIGAYYGKRQFGLKGMARPIIDGSKNTVPMSNTTFLIGSKNQRYVTIKDLRINNSGGYGISMKGGTYCRIENCYVYRPYRYGVGLAQMTYSTIIGCTVEESYYWKNTGDAIDVTALSSAGTSHHNSVIGNTVFHCNEGIGIYKKNDHILVEGNTLYDNDKYNIYVDASRNTTIRQNTIYTSIEGKAWGAPSSGIVLDVELERQYCYTGSTLIENNYIAGMDHAIKVSNNYGVKADTSCNWNGVVVSENYLVDSVKTNIYISGEDSGWSDNLIKDNKSYTISSGSLHTNNFSPIGFTWANNTFNDDVSGNAAIGAKIDENSTIKETNWRSLPPGSVSPATFSLTSSELTKSFADASPISNTLKPPFNIKIQ